MFGVLRSSVSRIDRSSGSLSCEYEISLFYRITSKTAFPSRTSKIASVPLMELPASYGQRRITRVAKPANPRPANLSPVRAATGATRKPAPGIPAL
jgi:hypothetical protein